MKSPRRLESGLLRFGAGFLVISPLGAMYTSEFHPGLWPHLVLTALPDVGIVYSLFGLVTACWRRFCRSDRLPFRIAVLTAGVAIGAVLGIEFASTGMEGVIPFRPSLVISCIVAWLLASIVAARGESSSPRRHVVTAAGIVLVLTVALATVLRDDVAARVELVDLLGIWLFASAAVVALAGLYAYPAYHLRTSLANAARPRRY